MNNLDELLDTFDTHVHDELKNKPDVIDVGRDLDLDDVKIVARTWHRVQDAVAVVADLKGSTRLGISKHPASTASIYEAAIKPLIETLIYFDAGDIAIQGDGAIGIFWGDRAVERAMCAAITIKTFSERHLVPRLTKKWPDTGLPDTGFKVGVATSPLLVKKVGVPRSGHQEEVWPGKAVNFATKAAQTADAHELVITGSMWDAIKTNAFLVASCDCGGRYSDLWNNHTIDRLHDDEPDRIGQVLRSCWCVNCGPAFCDAILDGKKTRPPTGDLLNAANARAMQTAIAKKAATLRENRRNLRYARTGR